MNLQKRLLYILLILAVPLSANAQRVVVQYDMVGDSIISIHKVKKDGTYKKLNKGYIPRDADITFKVTNVNDAAWVMEYKMTEESIPSATNLNFLNAIVPTGFDSQMPAGTLPFVADTNNTTKSRGEDDVWLDDETGGGTTDIDVFLSNLPIIKSNLLQLLYNTNYTEAEAKARASRLINAYLEGEDTDDVNARGMADQRKIAEVRAIAHRSFAATSRGDNDVSDSTIKLINKQLNEVEFLYNKIVDSDYEMSTRLDSEADEMRVNVQFYPVILDSTITGSGTSASRFYRYDKEQEPAITKSFRFKSRGGLKITNSLGVSFTSLFGQGKEFIIDASDNTIKVSKEDNFIPNLMIGLNFYPVLTDNFSLGGTFGIGIPTTVFNGSFDINFQLGAAMILGKRDVVTLTTGLLVGATEKLDYGYKVGDSGSGVTTIDDVTKTTYKPGYFLGISFKLATVVGGGSDD